jgi:hypothetical protein
MMLRTRYTALPSGSYYCPGFRNVDAEGFHGIGDDMFNVKLFGSTSGIKILRLTSSDVQRGGGGGDRIARGFSI